MKTLSTEILLIIFKYLHYKQKVQCMLACRKWATILQAGLNFETAVVADPNDERNYNAFMSKMKSGPDVYRQQCKRLVIECYFDQPCDYSKVLEYFPSLTYLYLNGDDVAESYLEGQQLKNLQIWRDKMNSMKIHGYGETFLQILNSGTFKSLVTLDIASNVMSSYRRIHLLNGLVNAPNIKHLTLSYLRIDINDLEKIHRNLPNLNSLILKAKEIKNNFEISEDVQPVNNNLKSLKIIQHYRGCIITLDVKQYIATKYRHLEEFTIIQPNHALDDIAKQIANMTVSLFSNIGQNLKHLDFELPCEPTENQDFLTSMNLIHLSTSLFLSERLLQSLILPSTIHRMQHLKLKEVPPLKFSIFRQCTELKVLELEFEEKSGPKYDVRLCQIVNNDLPEKLESLGLGYTKIHVDSVWNDDVLPNTNIKQLKLKRSELSKNLDVYITQHMKKLDTLFLHSCKIGFVTRKKDRLGILRIIKDHGKSRFELPDRRLKLVSIQLSNEHVKSGRKIEIQYELYSIPTHLKLTVGKSTQYYHSPKGGGLDYRRCGMLYSTSMGETKIGLEPFGIYSGENKESTYDRSIQRVHDSIPFDKNTRYFEFKCAHVQTIYFNGCLLL